MAEALRIASEAKGHDIDLRMLGALAFRIHCPEHRSLLDSMKREISDIDFVARSSQRNHVRELLESIGYKMDNKVLAETEGSRFFLRSRTANIGMDIFFDRLEMCHTIDFRNRLQIDFPTIPLAEMLLEKMQIVQIAEKDIKDTIVLLMEHELGNVDVERINTAHISSLLARDWGFYYTFETNLKKVKRELERSGFAAIIADDERKKVAEKIDALQEAIEREPKSLRWKMRAKVGPSKKWYRDVELDKRSAWSLSDSQ